MNHYTAPTSTEPPTILPRVTGIRLRPKAGHVSEASAAPCVPSVDQNSCGANCFTNNPNDTKYMLAIECSKPAATKAEIGSSTTTTLSVVVRAANETQTARQTSRLHSTPRKNA